MALNPSELSEEIYSFIKNNQDAFPSERFEEKVDKKNPVLNYFYVKEILDHWAESLFGKGEINYTLFSSSVRKSLSEPSKNVPHQAVDYQWLFLHHLIVNFRKGIGLIGYIDDFLDTYKEQLVLSDIGITRSGATRAKTHLRFAVNDLRNMGMVISRDFNKKRSWQPSIMGVLILLCALKKTELLERFRYLQHSALLPHDTQNTQAYTGGVRYYDARLFDKKLLTLIREYLEPGAFYGVIADVLTVNVATPYKELIEKLQENYVVTVIEGLTILENDVKKTKEFNSLSNKFHSFLADEEKNHEKLFNAVHNAYKLTWKGIKL
jgi:hypothetical protein